MIIREQISLYLSHDRDSTMKLKMATLDIIIHLKIFKRLIDVPRAMYLPGDYVDTLCAAH